MKLSETTVLPNIPLLIEMTILNRFPKYRHRSRSIPPEDSITTVSFFGYQDRTNSIHDAQKLQKPLKLLPLGLFSTRLDTQIIFKLVKRSLKMASFVMLLRISYCGKKI